MIRKQKKARDFLEAVTWTLVFLIIVMLSLTNIKKTEDPGYVQFPSDDELQEIELGLKSEEYEI